MTLHPPTTATATWSTKKTHCKARVYEHACTIPPLGDVGKAAALLSLKRDHGSLILAAPLQRWTSNISPKRLGFPQPGLAYDSSCFLPFSSRLERAAGQGPEAPAPSAAWGCWGNRTCRPQTSPGRWELPAAGPLPVCTCGSRAGTLVTPAWGKEQFRDRGDDHRPSPSDVKWSLWRYPAPG